MQTTAGYAELCRLYQGELFVVQARPETVHSSEERRNVLETCGMDPELSRRLREEGKVRLTPYAVGTRIGAGPGRRYTDYEEVIVRKRELLNLLAGGRALEDIPPEERVFGPGDVLVTELTTPDWEPMMKEASLVVTERGGRTSHAAIVAREFGIPAIVGAEDATRILKPLMEVTGRSAPVLGGPGGLRDRPHLRGLPSGPVLVRLSDLKSHEYRELLGGRLFEPVEENPIIAWRGASRYIDPRFLPAFDMECGALRMVRQRIGLDNLQLMVPFCRTPEEGAEVAGRSGPTIWYSRSTR